MNLPLFFGSESRSVKISRPIIAIKCHVFVLRHLALASHAAWELSLFLYESLPHNSHIAYISNEPPRNFRRMPGSHQSTISSSLLRLRPQWRRQGALGPWDFYFNMDGGGGRQLTGAQILGDRPWPPSGDELEYLVLNLIALANQMARYKLAEADVSVYVQSAAGATTFVPPNQSACLYVQYDVLFEEINKYIFPWLCVCVS
jgi:hypothetical protein